MQDAVIERLLPAIALAATRADDDEIAIGASKFGGAPDVPDGFAWPMRDDAPLVFMAQINLAEIAPFDIENQLPSSGVLSFFYDMNEDGDWPFGEMADEGGWRVFHFEGDLERAQVPEQAQISHGLQTATVKPQIFCSVPTSTFWINAEDDEFTEEEEGQWEELLEKFEKSRHSLAMLNHPHIIQNDARYETANWTGRGTLDDWIVLLQMDIDKEIDWMWGDTGAMFYLMHRDDLKARDWDKCWLNAQCC